MPISLEKARKAKSALAKKLEGMEGVVGIGITKTGEDYSVKVNFEAPPKEPIPSSIGGVPIQIEVTGKIRKQD